MEDIFSFNESKVSDFDLKFDKFHDTVLHLNLKNDQLNLEIILSSKSRILGQKITNYENIDEYYYILKQESKVLPITPNQMPLYIKSMAKKYGKPAKQTIKSTSYGINGITLAASFTGGDPGGSLITFSQVVRYLSSLRFIKVDQGDLFGKFLDEISEGMEEKSTYEYDTIVKSRPKTTYKFDEQKYAMTLTDTLLFKTLLYMVSFFFKYLSYYLLKLKIKEFKVTPFQYHIQNTINKLHFTAFNMFIVSAIIINYRNIFHMKFWPENNNLKLEKLINIVVFIMYWTDILHIILSCFNNDLSSVIISNKSGKNDKNEKSQSQN